MLVRHGRPEYEPQGKIRAREIPAVLAKYNAAGITDLPPEQVRQDALSCNAVVCSDLKRSLESARALGCVDIHCSDALFREVTLPHFNGGSLVLSADAWGFLLRGLSIVGFSRNGESFAMARARAKRASATLIEQACIHNSVLLVGHGFINYLIAKELLANNWTGPVKPGGRYWQHGIYCYQE